MKRALLFVFMASGVAFFSTFGLAQPRAPKGGGHGPKRASPKTDADASRVRDGGGAPATATLRGGGGSATEALGGDGGVLEARTLDGGAKVYRFGEMEIEGRLKSHQLVYFLRRVRAEFSADDLGHRPFLRELSETRKDPSF